MAGKWIAVLATALVAVPVAAQNDLSVDAVTRATTLNPMKGDVAVLTDGITPETDPQAGAVEGGGVGLLRVEWPRLVSLATIRIYAGLAERYSVLGYAGGTFNDQGQREEVETPAYSVEGLAPLDANIWFDIPCRPDIPIDNLGLVFVGTSIIYEVQFIGPIDTAVEQATLGLVKKPLAH